MVAEAFSLNSREEVVRFESLLDRYIEAKQGFSPRHISLAKAYDYSMGNSDSGQIFAAVLDIYISYLLIALDSSQVGATWNEFFSKGKLEGGSVLDSQEKFFGKMNIHRFNTAYVLRYRAIWDKLMGLMVLIYAPSEYNSFMKAKSRKSRKSRFIKIVSKCNLADQTFIDDINSLITDFDDTFRTSEAHGTGVLRKYSFAMESMAANPQIELIGFWNVLNSFICNLGKTFSNVGDERPLQIWSPG